MNIEKIVWGLEELSDYDQQKNLWTGKISGEMSSFTEAVSTTFDDSGLAIALDANIKPDEVSSTFWLYAKDLDRAVRKVPQNIESGVLVDMPIMGEVRVQANRLLIVALSEMSVIK